MKEKIISEMLVYQIVAWLAFIGFDAFAEYILDCSNVLDAGLISIPCILILVFLVREKKVWAEKRFASDYNLCVAVSHILLTVAFGAVIWIMAERDVWLIKQKNRGFILDLNGIEYLLYPFTLFAATFVAAIIKTIMYFVWKSKLANIDQAGGSEEKE